MIYFGSDCWHGYGIHRFKGNMNVDRVSSNNLRLYDKGGSKRGEGEVGWKVSRYLIISPKIGQPNFLRNFCLKLDFDPSPDSIPIFGSQRHHFTTTQEL